MMAKEAFSAFPHPDQEPEVMALWERFLLGRELSPHVVRDVIEGSWVRCQSAGIDPQRSQAAPPLPEEALLTLQQGHRDLIGASAPIMKQVRDFLSESGTIMILGDPAGTILESEGDPATLDAAWSIQLVTGANWNERACGTNAIGTALFRRQLGAGSRGRALLLWHQAMDLLGDRDKGSDRRGSPRCPRRIRAEEFVHPPWPLAGGARRQPYRSGARKARGGAAVPSRGGGSRTGRDRWPHGIRSKGPPRRSECGSRPLPPGDGCSGRIGPGREREHVRYAFSGGSRANPAPGVASPG